MATGRLVFDGDNIYTEKEARTHKLKEAVEQKIDAIPWVVDSVNSDSTTDALSAHMGKVLQDQITNMSGLNKFLSTWDCTTGLPTTDPAVSPYVYSAWNYYIVSNVAEPGGTNMRPHGRSYVTWQPSTAIETADVKENDWYIYDGMQWVLQQMSPQEIVIDEWLSPTSRHAVENRAVYNALTTKQNSILDLDTIRQGAAAWATAIQPWDNIDSLVNNLQYQTLSDVNTIVNNAIGWVTPDVNTKTFYLTATWDSAAVRAMWQSIYDWLQDNRNAIIVYSGRTYVFYWYRWNGQYPTFIETYGHYGNDVSASSAIVANTLQIVHNNGTVTAVSWWTTWTEAADYSLLRTNIDYATPYVPLYDGSPATKKYVDDSIEAQKSSWSTEPQNPDAWTIWYNTSNYTTYIYDWREWQEVITNTKTFVLAWNATSDLGKIQDIYDWVKDYKDAIIRMPDQDGGRDTYFFDKDNTPEPGETNWNLRFEAIDNEWQDWTSVSSQAKKNILIRYNWTTASWITYHSDLVWETYLATDVNYSTPYTPTYAGSPATKKYVDDKIAEASQASSSAPSNPSAWNMWYDTTNNILKVWDWTQWVSIQELLVSWTNIKTINGQSILWNGDLSTWEIVFVTAQQYTDLPATKETDGKVYFIYE